MRYESIPKLTREEFELEVQASSSTMCRTLLGIYEVDDWEWVQHTYLKYSNDQDKWIASAAITGLGHLARVHGQLDKDLVISHLEQLAQLRPELAGKVGDAISDIDVFVE